MKLKYLLIVFSVFLLAGCENFDDINTDPNSTTEANASMLCTSVITRIIKYDGADAKAYIGENALPKYVGYGNELQLGPQYNLITNASFDEMTILPNTEKMVEYGQEGVTPNGYLGVAKFARAFMFYRMTMEMGDVPYSEAGLGEDENLYKPVYDEQESIFAGILSELEEASAYFAEGETFDGDPTPYDGDSDKWRRACNAFRLKVLMTLSEKVDNTSIDVKGMFQDIVSEDYLLEESTGYWGLEYSSTNAHPLYSTSSMFTARSVLSDSVVAYLKKLDDRRLYYYAEPADEQTNAGVDESDPDAYIGADVSMNYTTLSTNLASGVYSIINLRYQLLQDSEPRRLITYAEQQLILAEARILGWISSGSAADYYESGVKSALAAMLDVSSDYTHGMDIDQAYIDSYFTGEAAFEDTEAEQLRQIWLQRYLMNFLVDGLTAYYEYRRTGYPEFPINEATSLNTNDKGAVPMRWLYPTSESLYNADNYTDAVERQYDGYDEINKRMWLLK